MFDIKNKLLPYRLTLLFGLGALLVGAASYTSYSSAPAAPSYLNDKDRKIEQEMVPHKALYEIEMVARHSGSPVLNISGQMLYEWRRNCEAWTTDHRFKLFYEYSDSAPMHITSDFSTYEPFDGKSFHFSSRRKRNGELFENLRGEAVRKNGEVKAVYSKPEGLEIKLPSQTLFPMAHTIALLDAAKAHNRFFNAPIFDGSDDQGPVEVNAFIGTPADAQTHITDNAELDTSLIASPAWNVRMAFFPLNEPVAESDYEMDVIFHENGVISDMHVDYQDFSVTQKLVALEKLEEKPECTHPENTSTR